jgi:Tetratricopeptide repeat
MAFNFFKKKGGNGEADEPDAQAAAGGDGDQQPPDKGKAGGGSNGFKRDPRKAEAFFRHAIATADSRQYDYSIDCYVRGLRHDPENMIRHEELGDVALKRLVAGGKKAGFKEQLLGGGREPVDKMLHAEMLWAKDPRNCSHALALMKRAAEANRAYDDLDLSELIHWIGEKVIELNSTAKKPSHQVYLDACDLFKDINSFQNAVEACQRAVAIDDKNGTLLQKLKDLEAEKTMYEANYEGESRGTVKDLKTQEELDAADQVGLADRQLEELIHKYRAEFEKDPVNLDRLHKLVKVLQQKSTEEADTEAIDLLQSAFTKTDQYKYKVQAGDLTMRRYVRRLRELKKEIENHPEDAYYKDQRDKTLKEKLQFELEEFGDRVRNYPTDLKLKFQLGQRMFAFKKYDEAISLFQAAKNDPKSKGMCADLLGQCYLAKGWLDEAIDTLKKGKDDHPLHDDKLGLDMRYRLMDALEQRARKNKNTEDARDAQAIASEILQININYKDIRQRGDTLRALMEELG